MVEIHSPCVIPFTLLSQSTIKSYIITSLSTNRNLNLSFIKKFVNDISFRLNTLYYIRNVDL